MTSLKDKSLEILRTTFGTQLKFTLRLPHANLQQYIFVGLQDFRGRQFEAVQAAASGPCWSVPAAVWQ